MGDLFHFDANLPYPERLEHLRKNHVALWDTLGQCERQGSLDTAIQHAIPNDIPRLLKNCPKITRILCNGTAAATHFRRNFPQYISMMTQLPSTSPAAARLTYSQKRNAWKQAICP